MQYIFFRIVVVILIVTFQYSVMNILWPGITVPVFLVAATVALTLVFKFVPALPMVIGIGIMTGCAYGSGWFDWFSIYLVFVSYVTSFLAGRFLFEHRGWGLLFAFGIVFGSSLVWKVGEHVLSGGMFISAFSVIGIMQILLVGGLSFVIAYPLVARFERYIKSSSDRQFRSVR